MAARNHRGMVACRSTVAVLSSLLLLGALLGQVSASTGLPARIVTLDPPISEIVHHGVDYGPTTSPEDDRQTTTTWRVVQHTGNCCENNLTTTPDGRLIDFGGSYVNFSDDRGETWRQAQSLIPMIAGEGAIVPAPGGDVLGVGWDLNSADQLQFYKYEADTDQWLTTVMPVHAPFYDREWIGVVPGPVTVDGETHEYISFVKGGAPPLDETWFYSTDGLNYLGVQSKALEQILGGAAAPAVLGTSPDPLLDWAQTNTNAGMTALGGGGFLSAPDLPDGLLDEAYPFALFDGDTFSWSSFVFPDGSPPTGRFQVDSAGRIHNVVPAGDRSGFDYRVSADGGQTWHELEVALPPSHTLQGVGDGAWTERNQWDFRANLAVGIAAVAVRAHDATTGTAQDMVYTLDITGDEPVLRRWLEVGLGDMAAGGGTSGGTVRMDFGSVAIFDDGRVALSFLDSTTRFCACTLQELDQLDLHPNDWQGTGPAIAIELDTEVDD